MKLKWLIALLLGVAAGTLHFLYVRALEAETKGGEDMEVLVAGDDLAGGQPVSFDSFALRSVPVAYVDARVVPADRLSELEGLTPSVHIDAGQMIQWTDFQERPDEEIEDLSALVEPGNRAMAIPVNSSLSLGGMLRSGNRVDILGTFSRGKNQRTDKVTVTLLQNVTVLATGKDLGAGSGRYSTVTLSVGLEESELLAFATTQGTLSLVLRGNQDLDVVRDVPEKGMEDVWEAERRNALQERPRGERRAIERLKAR